MTDWPDISTAPKDGTEVLGIYVTPSGRVDGPWTMQFDGRWDHRWIPSWNGSRVTDGVDGYGATVSMELDNQPTHWHPLPEPPLANEG
jgi:hypothetical protein